MEFLVNLVRPKKAIIVTQKAGGEIKDLGVLSLDRKFQQQKFTIGGDRFKAFPTEHHEKIIIADADGKFHALTYGKPLSIRTEKGAFKLLLRDELLEENPTKVPEYIKHSFVLHLLLLVAGIGLSLTQPKIPEKLIFEVETKIIENEPPKEIVAKPPPPPPPQPKQQVVAKKAAPQPKPKPMAKAPVKKRAPKPAIKSPSKNVAKAPPPPAASTPNPAKVAAAAQRASVAKSLNFLSSNTGGIAAGPTFTKNKNGSVYGAGSEQTLNAKNASILNKVGARSSDGNIRTKGSRLISSAVGVSGDSKSLNDVQGRVSASALYSKNAMVDFEGGNGLSLSGNGTIPQSLIEKILAKHIDKLRYCYEKALLSDASLGGNMLMQWTIANSGSAKNIRTLRTAINNSPMQSCINREISKIPFPKPSGGEVLVKFPFSFTSSTI